MITREEILSLGFEPMSEVGAQISFNLTLGGTVVLTLTRHETDLVEIGHLNTLKASFHYSMAFDTVFCGWVRTKADLVKVLNMVCNFVHPAFTYSENVIETIDKGLSVPSDKKTGYKQVFDNVILQEAIKNCDGITHKESVDGFKALFMKTDEFVEEKIKELYLKWVESVDFGHVPFTTWLDLQPPTDSHEGIRELMKFMFEKHFEIYELAKCSDDRFAGYSDLIYEKSKSAIDKYQLFKKKKL